MTTAAAALNCAVAEPAATVTEPGTVRFELFEARLRLVEEVAAADKDTVHWVEPAPVRLLGLQIKPAMVVGAAMCTWALTVLAFKAADTIAEIPPGADPAVAVNCAETEPCGT